MVQYSTARMSGNFLYFAYGSNLLAKRIHINNPSATRVGIGKLENYQLDFNTYSKRWRGASATIQKRPGRCVWGAIWEIDNEHLTSLDKQEGVGSNLYFRHNVELIKPDNTTINCWVYEQVKVPCLTPHIEELADDRKPSTVYLNVILQGAAESGLPTEYQEFLKKIPHNGYSGEVDIGLPLNIIK